MNGLKQKGITLIALVVTIVVLLILAGVSINLLTGENGIVTKAHDAKERTEKSSKNEQESLEILGDLISKYEKKEKVVISTKYYSSLLDAISDANNDVTTNGGEDSNGAKAKIEVDQNNNVYVMPLEDVLINTIVQVGSEQGYTLDLNNRTITLSEGSHFDQLVGTKLILDDSGTNGNVTKNVNSSSTQNVLRSSGKLELDGGIYNLTNNGSGTALNFRVDKATLITNGGIINSVNTNTGGAIALQISGESSDTTINNINCSTNTISGNSFTLFASTSSSTEENANITINGGTFTSNTEQGPSFSGYFSGKNVIINAGKFNIKSATNNSYCAGILAVKRNNITINNVNVNVYSSGTRVVYGVYIQNNTGICIINGGEYYVDTSNAGNSAVRVQNSNVEINNGSFIADSKLITDDATATGLVSNTQNLVVNGGYFRGTHSGAEIVGSAYINGGTFESPNHGGLYFGGNVNIKNATLKLGTYKGNYSENANISHYGVFYIGNYNEESKVYMDNVTLISDFGNKPGVLSSNYNHKDTYLYVSNTTFPGAIRVDGTRNDSQNPTAQGHLYVGKNVTYSGITSGSSGTTGLIDTTTYENKEFLND